MTSCAHSVLFLGKRDDEHVEKALQFCERNFSEVTVCLGEWGDALPDIALRWEGDFIFSYLSRWIVPEDLLGRARIAALNFHPAPPEYPGFGPNNFALYEGSKVFGVTCHHMDHRVDSGSIVAVSRFAVFGTDTVCTLLDRTYSYQLVLFFEIVSTILKGDELPTTQESWGPKKTTRKELDQLGIITVDMDRGEIARRLRATNFRAWKPVLSLHGFNFELKAE